MGEFYYGYRIYFILEDVIEEIGKVSMFFFFLMKQQVKKIMGFDLILFWFE